MIVPDRSGIAEEAARIICEEALTDYRGAKLKALERLGLPPRTPLPDNARVEAAVIDYLRLFGGAAYETRLRRMRALAPRLMRRLESFEPRLTGGAVSGAVTAAHRLQLHVFADQAEALDVFLLELGIDFDEGERRYRYSDGREIAIPLARFELEGVGVDIAVFPHDELHRPPLSPNDGAPYRRLGLDEAERLAAGSR
ncbi:hypothetical protein [Solimonas soli]|uniref:hypothetical protein n=1 Tax=Solimonas soli TaxID=413479 RepID=UPI000481E6AB|nr:hypothetical protein [Solimonas soli]